MLELYDRKFVLTTEDGKLVSTYHDFYEAQTDALHLTTVHQDEKFFVWELKDQAQDDDTLTRIYSIKETLEYTPEIKEEEKKEEESSGEDKEDTPAEESKEEENTETQASESSDTEKEE